jgi:hypothetical protein
MDITRLTFKELFTIKLVHTGYLTSTGSTIFNKVNIVPDKETAFLFARYSIDYRCINDSLFCFMRAEYVSPPAKEPKKPFVLFNSDFRIRFLITVQSEFINNTFLTAAGKEAVYHFTNKVDHVQSGKNLLSRPLENFVLSKSYDAGTLIGSGGEMFTSLKPVKASDVIPISNGDYWKKILPPEPVVNNADLDEVSTLKPDQSCLAVIDIFNSGTSNPAYNLFGGGQQLLSPLFTIPFKSKI